MSQGSPWYHLFMQKIFPKVLIFAGIIGVLRGGYGCNSQGTVALLFWFWVFFSLTSLSLINLGVALLYGKVDGAYRVFSIVSALVLGAISVYYLPVPM